MWVFTMGHELPYDDPEAARRRLRVRYPIRADRLLGGGELPNVRLQRALAGLGRRNAPRPLPLLGALAAGSSSPTARSPGSSPATPSTSRARRGRCPPSSTSAAPIYLAVPTAPPWWASEEGYTDAKVRRIMVEVGEEDWGRAWPALYDTLGGNPWAAMPSLHFATSLMAALLLAEAGPSEGALGWATPGRSASRSSTSASTTSSTCSPGAALVIAVRRGERYAEPVAQAISRGLQRLERIANPEA